MKDIVMKIIGSPKFFPAVLILLDHEPHPNGMRSYIPSQGLKRPITVREIVPAKTWRINPKAPQSWRYVTEYWWI